jgi:hypothetical protein
MAKLYVTKKNYIPDQLHHHMLTTSALLPKSAEQNSASTNSLTVGKV